jgi:hypothetical protein
LIFVRPRQYFSVRLPGRARSALHRWTWDEETQSAFHRRAATRAVNQTNVLTPQLVQGGFEVIHLIGDVVNTFPALSMNLATGGPGTSAQRSSMRLSPTEKGDLDLLLSDDLGPLKFHPHDITIERNMAIDAFYSDADMVDFSGKA